MSRQNRRKPVSLENIEIVNTASKDVSQHRKDDDGLIIG